MGRRYTSRALATGMCLISAAPFVAQAAGSLISGGGATLMNWYRVLLASPKYLLRFWMSLGLALTVALGQTAVSALAGYGFARCRFPGRGALFFALTVLMLLPLQVTLVPNYIVLDRLGLLDSYWCLILPAVFAPLGTFILAQGFRAVPGDVIDAARVDGCGTMGIILRVALPMNRTGLVCAFLLSFLDAWSMVEQPVAYIRDRERWPLAVSLASSFPADRGVSLACCVLATLPPLMLFVRFGGELTSGIALGEGR